MRIAEDPERMHRSTLQATSGLAAAPGQDCAGGVPARSPGVGQPAAAVVVVSHGFQTNYERGFCNGLAARGWAVTLVSSDRTDTAGLHPDVEARNLRGSQEEARPWWSKLFNILRYHAQLLVLVWRRRQGWIVHVIGLTDPPLLCGVLEGWWFRCLSQRYVLTVHDLLPHDNHSRWMKWVHARIYRIPHHLVVHTRRMAEELERDFGVDRRRISVMEHGIEPRPAGGSGSSRALPVPLPTPRGTLRLLFFGHVMRYKGLDVLFQALEDPGLDVELVVSGLCIDAALTRELEALLQAHPHRERITWHNGFVTEARMEELFVSADAVVLPYRHIDQSGVLFQALRLGVPLIATRAGSLDTYVSADIGELCAPGSVPELRDAIRRFAARREDFLRERVREQGRRFEWPNTVGALQAAYLTDICVERRRARGPILFIGEGRLGNQVFQYVAVRALLGEAHVWTTGLSALQRVFEPVDGVRCLLRPGLAERIVRRFAVPLLLRPLFKWLRLGDYCHEPMGRDGREHLGMSGAMSRSRGLLPLTFVDGGYYQNLSALLAPQDFQRLRPRPELVGQARAVVQRALQGRPWPGAVLHVRRGDYVGWSSYGLSSVLLPDAYFARAIGAAREHLGPDAQLLVVSDDTQWCQRELARFGPLTVVSVNEAIDFVLLTMFPVVILSNSTFSLAAACIGRGVELIIGPEYWFGHAVRRWLPFHIRSSDPRFRYV